MSALTLNRPGSVHKRCECEHHPSAGGAREDAIATIQSRIGSGGRETSRNRRRHEIHVVGIQIMEYVPDTQFVGRHVPL
jgi:hypothetical protein